MSENIIKSDNFSLLSRYDFLDLCLVGETGTGKTHTARLIHNASPRAGKPFIAVNCAELSPTLIESELFGYERGAFTGASGSRAGKFEAASDGTLFLDEIGELPSDIQAKLLKVVEEKRVTPVGSNQSRAVNARIIYATHRDLSVLREDLRYRIAAYTIHLAPLRERTEEIVPLAREFMANFNRKSGRTVTASDDVLRLLERAEWRGNVRELRSFVEKICLEALFAVDREDAAAKASTHLTGEMLLARLPAPKKILTDVFPDAVRETALTACELRLELSEPVSIWERMKQIGLQASTENFLQVYENLRQSGKNNAEIAAEFGISERTLYYRLSQARNKSKSDQPKKHPLSEISLFPTSDAPAFAYSM